MKMKPVLLVSFLSLAVLATTSAFAAGNGRGGGNRGATNPGRTIGVPTPKRDGTGGPGKPANPSCPQDGSGAGRNGPRR